MARWEEIIERRAAEAHAEIKIMTLAALWNCGCKDQALIRMARVLMRRLADNIEREIMIIPRHFPSPPVRKVQGS